MKLKTARVENFKCVDNSEDFGIDQVTCLVGKNEAGKSALLEAIYRLNPVDEADAAFLETEFPRRHLSTYRQRKDESPANVLTTVWTLDAGDSAAVKTAVGFDQPLPMTATITKGYTNVVSCAVEVDEEAFVADAIGRHRLDATESSTLRAAKTVGDLRTRLEGIPARSEKQEALLTDVRKRCPKGTLSEVIAAVLIERIPTMILFRDYDKLPGRVSMTDLAARKNENRLDMGDKVFIALLELAQSSPEEVANIQELEPFIMELEAIKNRTTDEIFRYWSQNKHLDVEFRCDQAKPKDPAPFNKGWIFSTRINNRRHRATVNFEERSTGFIWFFSFLVWFSQLQDEYGDSLVVLLDEPGLTLHGKAQADLLRYFNERLRPRYQVIYTTHSPFMIDVQNVFSVRTVEDASRVVAGNDEVLGTKVGQRILSRDRDTILPLQGILGYDLAQSMFVGPYVLVVEGPSEAGYVNWFARTLAALGRTTLDLRWAVAPAEGASKISSFVTLFKGRGLKIAALMDYHPPEKRTVDELEASGLLDPGHLLRTTVFCGQAEADIEDLVGWPAYADLVNGHYGLGGVNALPAQKPANAGERTVKIVEAHFRTLPPGIPEFDHFAPVQRLLSLEQAAAVALSGMDQALDRFEQLFKAVNSLAP